MASSDVDRGTQIFDHIWVTSRGMAEYREYFRLSEVDLARSFLDCTAGAASFAAEVCALGGKAIAADWAYAIGPAELLARAERDLAATLSTHTDHSDLLGEGIFASQQALVADRARSLKLFAQDFMRRPDGYVGMKLPDLPFTDESFDTVLSGYLLFCYGDRLGLDFHRAAIREMLRVAREEVRLTPICTAGGLVPEWRDQLFAELADVARIEILDGINCTLRPATETLVLRPIR